MKLSAKWLLLFILVSLYAAVIGGLLYYNMFKSVFDEKLQSEMIEMVRFRTPNLVQALSERPKEVASFREAEIMKDWRRNDDRIKNLIYLNYDGSIRWHENTKFLGMSYSDYNNQVGFDSNAVVRAIRDRKPWATMFDNGNYYDMAIPLLAKGDAVAGVVNVTVSRTNAKSWVRGSMVRYAIGALLMMLFVGAGLYLFVLLHIVRPISYLKDSIDTVSSNNPNLNFPARSDEIGDLAHSIEGLLGKVRTELSEAQNSEIMSVEKEQKWWKTILAVAVPKGARALVIDENNNILYTNFELNTTEAQKVHLLDIFDGRQQDLIQIIGQAMEQPTKVFRGKVVNKNVAYVAKAVQLPDDNGKNRMLLVLEQEEENK